MKTKRTVLEKILNIKQGLKILKIVNNKVYLIPEVQK